MFTAPGVTLGAMGQHMRCNYGSSRVESEHFHQASAMLYIDSALIIKSQIALKWLGKILLLSALPDLSNGVYDFRS